MSGKKMKKVAKNSKSGSAKLKFDARFCIGMLVAFLFVVFLFNVFLNFVTSLFLFPFVLLICIYSSIVLLNFKKERTLVMRRLFNKLGASSKHDYRNLPVSILACSFDGTVLWCNDFFEKNVKIEDGLVGFNFLELVNKPFASFCGNEGVLVEFKGLSFKVRAVKLEDLNIYILSFENCTDYAELKKEHEFSKPCVLYIIVDNYKEIFTNKKESEKSAIMGKVDNIIEEFVEKYFGIMQKYREDEFLVILEQRYLDVVSAGRFEILQSVRNIMNGERFGLTISVGIGALAKNLGEGKKFAMQALDMALGRGGDQVVIKTPTSFKFFGGNSKGVEKRTRAKARVVARALLKLIEDSENVLIMGHKFCDLDSAGSAIGLSFAIEKLGKRCNIVINSEKNLADVLVSKAKNFGFSKAIVDVSLAFELVKPKTLLIILDTHNPDFIESFELYSQCDNVVVIDHHRKAVDCISNAVIFYHEPYASSTAELVCELIQNFGDRCVLEPVEAEALLSGIMLDTKNFSMKVGVRTFEAAAYLKRLGADTVAVRKLFSNSMDYYQKMVRIVVGAEIYRGCAIAISDFKTDDMRTISPQAADELLGIVNVEASFVIYQIEDVVNISARSLGKLNVQVIMEGFGGGGHQLQAACQLKDVGIEAAKQMLLQAIDCWLDGN